jgi:shikimate dehydrogenase
MSRFWRLGVVGQPVAHSLSPRLHLAGLRRAGLEGQSEPVELGREDAGVLRAWMGERFDALSVTMPLKEVAAGQCDILSPTASRIGAVNSLLWREGRIEGAATDGAGLLAALRWRYGFDPRGASVVVLGAGGAAAGIVEALVSGGARRVAVRARRPERARRLGELGSQVAIDAAESGAIDLVVNTIPVDGREPSPPLAGATWATIAVDIAYEPRETPWRAAYHDLGCASTNGLDMLAFQAAEQMRWWWGLEVSGADLVREIE